MDKEKEERTTWEAKRVIKRAMGPGMNTASIGLDITHASGARDKQLGGSTVQAPVTLITRELPAAAGVPKNDRSLGRKYVPQIPDSVIHRILPLVLGPFIPVGLVFFFFFLSCFLGGQF